MKIVYQNVICLLFFVVYNYMSLAETETVIDVVGFFDENDSQADLAFKVAIHNFNMVEENIKYKAISHVVTDTDSFKNGNFFCLLTENTNVGGVLCPTSPKIAPIIESLCSNLLIPAIQVDWRPFAPYYVNNTLVKNFYPYPPLLFQGLGVIVKNLQWRSVVIFYESTENLLRLQDILKLQNFENTAKSNIIIVKELGPGPDYRSTLKQIANISEHRIILDCKTENVITILKQAKELKLLEKHFSYFITSLDAHTLDLSVLNTAANITTVRIFDPENKAFQDALSRWDQYAGIHHVNSNMDKYTVKTQTALVYDAMNVYMKSLRDLHVSGTTITPRNLNCQEENERWENGFQIATFMNWRKFERGSPECVTSPLGFNDLGQRINFTIYVVEGNRDDVVATWVPENPGVLNFLKSEEDRNKELERKWTSGVLTVASILGKPYLMQRVPPKGVDPYLDNDRYEGFSKDLIEALSRQLNHFKYKLEVLPNTDRGIYNEETKQWNGLIREVLDRRADLAICDLTITPARREVVDFSTPFMRIGISILYKKPEAKEANMYAFLHPLSPDLWIYTATLYLAVTVVLFFIARLSPKEWENPHPCNLEPEELENIWDMKNCLWLTLGSIMNQGCDILPKGLATRMATVMWWFYAIIVTNSYMANLAAFLTNERTQNTINSAEDLAKQTKIKYGTMDKGSTQAFFRDSNYSVYQRMWTNMQQSRPSVFENNNADGVARVQKEKNNLYAFLMESATLEYEIETKCDLMQVGNWLDSKSYGIAMPLDYPHRSRINEALLKLQENGEINTLKTRWWVEKQVDQICQKESADETSANKLALQNVGGVFIVLAVGMALSYLVVLFEFLWNVRNVSVEEHISFWQALKVELLFALNVAVTKKRVKPEISESSSQSAESRSLAHSILRGAGSFLRLDVLGKAGTPGSPTSSRHTSRPLD